MTCCPCLPRINVAEMRQKSFGQLPQPGRLVAKLDHLHHERVDPRSLVLRAKRAASQRWVRGMPLPHRRAAGPEGLDGALRYRSFVRPSVWRWV